MRHHVQAGSALHCAVSLWPWKRGLGGSGGGKFGTVADPVVPATGRLRPDCKFNASLGYSMSLNLPWAT